MSAPVPHRPRGGLPHRPGRPRRDRDEAVRITSARESAEKDLHGREVRYLISMGVRVACFVGAVLVGPGWLRWVLVAGAVFLPYVAVVAANARTGPGPEIELRDVPGRHRELGEGERREDDR